MSGAKVNIGNGAQQGYSLHGLNFQLLKKSFSFISNDSDFLKNSNTFSPKIKTPFQLVPPHDAQAQAGDEASGVCHLVLHGLSLLLVVCTFPFSLFVCLKIVAEYERAVIFRLGRLVGAKGPGLFFVLPCMDEIQRVDLRTISFDIPPQEILTKDSVTCAVDAVVYYRVFNPAASVTNVANAAYSTKLLAQTTLRNQLGAVTLAGLQEFTKKK